MALKILALETEIMEGKQNQKFTPKDKETQSEKVLKALSRKVLNLDSEIEDLSRQKSEKDNKNKERLEINDLTQNKVLRAQSKSLKIAKGRMKPRKLFLTVTYVTTNYRRKKHLKGT